MAAELNHDTPLSGVSVPQHGAQGSGVPVKKVRKRREGEQYDAQGYRVRAGCLAVRLGANGELEVLLCASRKRPATELRRFVVPAGGV